MAKGIDALWNVVNEFGARARANRELVEEAVRCFLAAETVRHRAASSATGYPCGDDEDAVFEVLTPGEVRSMAMHDGAIYRRLMKASESDEPSCDEMITYLVRLTDLVVDTDKDRRGRQSRQSLAPKLDGRDEVILHLLIFPDDLAGIRQDMGTKGSHRAIEYLHAVRKFLPLPADVAEAEATAMRPARQTGQHCKKVSVPSTSQATPPPPPPPPAEGQPNQKWSRIYSMEEAAEALRSSTDKIWDHLKKYPSSGWHINRETHRFDLNDGLFLDLEPAGHT
ncbi:MAG: hypothetical protein LLG03_02965 [Planctomycetaceae bacterium]|nr:hypothetical protein [Planctomycetaceae bacterium]